MPDDLVELIVHNFYQYILRYDTDICISISFVSINEEFSQYFPYETKSCDMQNTLKWFTTLSNFRRRFVAISDTITIIQTIVTETS